MQACKQSCGFDENSTPTWPCAVGQVGYAIRGDDLWTEGGAIIYIEERVGITACIAVVRTEELKLKVQRTPFGRTLTRPTPSTTSVPPTPGFRSLSASLCAAVYRMLI